MYSVLQRLSCTLVAVVDEASPKRRSSFYELQIDPLSAPRERPEPPFSSQEGAQKTLSDGQRQEECFSPSWRRDRSGVVVENVPSQ